MVRWCKQLDRQPRGSQIHLQPAYEGFFCPNESSFCKASMHVLLLKNSIKKVNTVAKHPASQAALQALLGDGYWLSSASPVLVLLPTPQLLSSYGSSEQGPFKPWRRGTRSSPLRLWLPHLREIRVWTPLKGTGKEYPHTGTAGTPLAMGVRSPPAELVCPELCHQGTLSIIKSLFPDTMGFPYSSQTHFLWLSDILMCSGTTP